MQNMLLKHPISLIVFVENHIKSDDMSFLHNVSVTLRNYFLCMPECTAVLCAYLGDQIELVADLSFSYITF